MPQLNVYLDRETYEALSRVAKERGMALYDMVKEVLRDFARRAVFPPTLEERIARLEAAFAELKNDVDFLMDIHMEERQAQPQQPPQPPPAQAQPPQQPQQPEPKLIPASELPEARKALEEVGRVEARTELRPFVIFWSPKDLEKAKRWLEANGRPVTGEVEVLRKGKLVKVVFGTTPEVVDRYCEKLTELKVPTGALDDKAERDRLDAMFAEEPFVEFGTRAYLLNRAGLIYRDRDGAWRKA